MRANGPRHARHRGRKLRKIGYPGPPRRAQQTAQEQGIDLVLCDGSPGIGCPVIASLSGASLALYVVEPTVSGVHDFCRVAELAARLDVPGLMAVNKADLNEAMTREIETMAQQHGIALAGRIPYDREVTRAQIARKTVVEASDGPAARAMHDVWAATQKRLQSAVSSTTGALVQIES